jgi:hypothetical protein
MKLFELTNGYTGESYVRCYAWAADEAHARILYELRHGAEPREVRELFDWEMREFITDLSDSGWEGGPPVELASKGWRATAQG